MRHPPAVNLQYFLCITTHFKGCCKVVQPSLSLVVSHNEVEIEYGSAVFSSRLRTVYVW